MSFDRMKAEEWVRAIYDDWLREAMPSGVPITWLCGYNPQALLPAPDEQAVLTVIKVRSCGKTELAGEMIRTMAEDGELVLLVGDDVQVIEHYLLATFQHESGVRIVLDAPGGEIEGFYKLPIQPKVAKRAPPAYLRHDPTKKHKRTRR